MQYLASHRKIVDPHIDRISRRADLDLHWVTFAQLRRAVIETKAEAAIRDQASDAHCVEVRQGLAQRRRYNVDFDFGAGIWKEAPRELHQLAPLVAVRHGPRNDGRALR